MMNINTLDTPQFIGFETEKHYFYEKNDRWKFNALRIVSYIPIISMIGVLVKRCALPNPIKPLKDRNDEIEKKASEFKSKLQQYSLQHAELSRQMNKVSLEVMLATITKEEGEQKIKVIQQEAEALASECSKIEEENAKLIAENSQIIQKIQKLQKNIFKEYVRDFISIFGLGVVFLPLDIYKTVTR